MRTIKNPNGLGGITKLSGKRRRPYWVRLTKGWELKDGKARQVYETLGYYATRKDALLALSAYHQNPIDLTKKGITFSEVWDIISPKYFEKNPKSVNSYKAAFNKCISLHNLKMDTIKAKHLQDVIDSMSNMSEQSQKKVKTVYKMIYKYCLENDILTKDYSAFVTIDSAQKTDVTDKIFTADELKLLFNAHDASLASDVIMILLYTGMRIGELLELNCSDINLNESYMHVKGTKTANANRIVPIHDDIKGIIERRINDGLLIGMTYNDFVRKYYNKHLKALGIKHTPHALRHTFISMLDKCNISPVALKRIVGHANTSVTEHYTHKDITDLKETIKALDYVTYLSLTELNL